MILVSIGEEAIVRLSPTNVGQEEFLQSYINTNPEVIPLDDHKEGARLLVLGREFPTPSGPIDVLAIDQDGGLYVIETKLFKNADKRKVLAQMFDYGAALWDLPSDEFMSSMQAVSKAQFNGANLSARVSEFVADEEDNEESIIRNVVSHKENGSITFIVLMDEIGTRLKTLIRYINANSRFDVLGVSLEFYNHKNTEIIIPDLYGAEVRKEIESKSGSDQRRSWDESSFFERTRSQVGDDELEVIRQLYEWSNEKTESIKWGSGKENGSFGPVFSELCTRTVFAVYSHARVEVHLSSEKDSEELKIKMRNLANSLIELKLLDKGHPKKDPSFPVNTLIGSVDQFLSAIEQNLDV